MRGVIDTNVIVSALLAHRSVPWQIVDAWFDRRFVLLTCERQLQELSRTLRKPELVARIVPREAGRVINGLRHLAVHVDPLPFVRRSPDPDDDYLLAASQMGRADYLVTGDKAGLLALRHHQGTKIMTARQFLDLL